MEHLHIPHCSIFLFQVPSLLVTSTDEDMFPHHTVKDSKPVFQFWISSSLIQADYVLKLELLDSSGFYRGHSAINSASCYPNKLNFRALPQYPLLLSVLQGKLLRALVIHVLPHLHLSQLPNNSNSFPFFVRWESLPPSCELHGIISCILFQKNKKGSPKFTIKTVSAVHWVHICYRMRT